jgi:putative (di)nucleoside polyphosphate hydrolase
MAIVLPEHLRDHPQIRMTHRPNAAAIIRDPRDQIMWCERSGAPGVWQFPQGGVDEGETVVCGMWREVSEELGIGEPRRFMTIEARLEEPLCYDFPIPVIERFLAREGHSYIGQSQHFFLLRWRGDDRLITLRPPDGEQPEFAQFVWGDTGYLARTSPFKTEVTRLALRGFGLL